MKTRSIQMDHSEIQLALAEYVHRTTGETVYPEEIAVISHETGDELEVEVKATVR